MPRVLALYSVTYVVSLSRHNNRHNNLSLLNRDLGDFSLVVRVDYCWSLNKWTTCGLQQPSL
jgi:hypothetical protein